MRAVHALVHHEHAGFKNRALTGLENHRTDGEFRRSASLHDFDVWLFLEAQCAAPGISDFDGKSLIGIEFHVAVLDLLLIHCDGCGPAPITATSIGEEDCGDNQ